LPLIKRIRERQIRITARAFIGAEKLPGGSRFMHTLAHSRLTAPLLNAALGYLRVFDSLQEAEAAARSYSGGGHEHPDYAKLHMAVSQEPRPSDYAALFHLRGLDLQGARIFDVGGNAGNLFYLYDRYLPLPGDCIWQVFDLPKWAEAGKKEAARRGEERLRFTVRWEDADGASVLLVSGSLHYFAPPLWQRIAALAAKPSFVLINRTPLIEGPTKATVQDAGICRVACVLYNRAEVILGFEAAGYELVDSWKAWERSLKRAGRPEASAAPYSGLFFRRKRSSI